MLCRLLLILACLTLGQTLGQEAEDGSYSGLSHPQNILHHSLVGLLRKGHLSYFTFPLFNYLIEIWEGVQRRPHITTWIPLNLTPPTPRSLAPFPHHYGVSPSWLKQPESQPARSAESQPARSTESQPARSAEGKIYQSKLGMPRWGRTNSLTFL